MGSYDGAEICELVGLLRSVTVCYGLLRSVTVCYGLLRSVTVCYGEWVVIRNLGGSQWAATTERKSANSSVCLSSQSLKIHLATTSASIATMVWYS